MHHKELSRITVAARQDARLVHRDATKKMQFLWSHIYKLPPGITGFDIRSRCARSSVSTSTSQLRMHLAFDNAINKIHGLFGCIKTDWKRKERRIRKRDGILSKLWIAWSTLTRRRSSTPKCIVQLDRTAGALVGLWENIIHRWSWRFTWNIPRTRPRCSSK